MNGETAPSTPSKQAKLIIPLPSTTARNNSKASRGSGEGGRTFRLSFFSTLSIGFVLGALVVSIIRAPISVLGPSSSLCIRGGNDPETRVALNDKQKRRNDDKNEGTDFGFAQSQSFGFFTDVQRSDWERMRRIVADTDNYLPQKPPPQHQLPRVFHQENFEPEFSCPFERRVGGLGDGPKWLCDPHRIPAFVEARRKKLGTKSEKCLVYSVGCNGQFEFEEGLVELLGTGVCEIHSFDFDDFGHKVPESLKNDIVMHTWGIHESQPGQKKFDKQLKGRVAESLKKIAGMERTPQEKRIFLSLPETVQVLQHTHRTIDVLKLDCEKCEYKAVQDFISMLQDYGVFIHQILVELHGAPFPGLPDFFHTLHKEGYVLFHKEFNVVGCGGNCVEYAFIKLEKEFFENA